MVCAVLSGNRNFEGRINQDVKANYLASPPLVVAYALAGRIDLDLTSEPLGEGSDGEPVYLRDIWPDAAEIEDLVGRSIARRCSPATTATCSRAMRPGRRSRCPRATATPGPDSTYVRRPAFFEGMPAEAPGVEPIARRAGARPARRLDHHRSHLPGRGDQGGRARPETWLIEHGVEPRTSTPTARAAATTR